MGATIMKIWYRAYELTNLHALFMKCKYFTRDRQNEESFMKMLNRRG